MNKKTLALLLCAATAAPSVYATISFDLQVDQLQTLTGQAMSSSGVVMLLADTQSNGFGAVEAFSFAGDLSTGLTSNGSTGDDLVLWVSDLSNNGIDGVMSAWASGVSLGSYGSNTLSEGDALALVWFPDVSLGDGLVEIGVSYGLFAQASGSLGSEWLTPADGSSAHALYAFTDNSILLPGGADSGALNSSLLVADQITVPEPAAASALLGLVTLGCALARRRVKR